MKDIIIKLDVRDKKYFVSKYNDEVIDPELSEYIMNYMIGTNVDSKVIMDIDSKIDLTKEEAIKYSEVIKREFSENIDEIVHEIKKSNIKKIIVTLLGVAFIALSYIIDTSTGDLLSQVLMIFGWVAIWEVAYGLLFLDAKRKRSLKRYKQLYNAEIKFR